MNNKIQTVSKNELLAGLQTNLTNALQEAYNHRKGLEAAEEKIRQLQFAIAAALMVEVPADNKENAGVDQ